jgi:hypothetical protein
MAETPITISNDNGTTKVSPNDVSLSIRNSDSVKWQGSADFTVTFDNGSPFSQSSFSGGAGNPASSGACSNGTNGTEYKYTAQISGATAVDPTIKTNQ